MAYGMPLWNEETGWTPLDELPPGTLPTNSGLITGVDPWGGGQPLPSSTHMTEYQDPRVLGSPQMLSGARSRGNTTPTTPPNSTAGNDAFNAVFGNGTTPRNTTSTGMPTFAPTGAQVQANPSAYAGTSFDPARNLTSGYPTGGANSMGMTGAGTTSYNGQTYGGYTGANAPLNSQLFNQQNGATQPQLDYVRNIDQVSYYKYILPLQQAGLIDISNPQQVNAAIQQGLARDGGGQWASGSQTSSVQGSPYASFLTSGDPRAQAINQFMLSGDQNAIAAANDWLSKNIDSSGRAKTALDNIQAWSQRFDNYYFPNKQFNPNAITPGGGGGGGQQTPPPGGGQPPQYSQYNGAQFNPNSSTVQAHSTGNNQVPAYLQQMEQAMLAARNSGQQFDVNAFLGQNFNPQQMGLQQDPQRPDFYIDPRTGNRFTRSGAQMISPQQWQEMTSQYPGAAGTDPYASQVYTFDSTGAAYDINGNRLPPNPNGRAAQRNGQAPVIGSPGMLGRPGQMQVDPAMGGMDPRQQAQYQYQQYANQIPVDPNHPAGRSDYVQRPDGTWGPGPNSPQVPQGLLPSQWAMGGQYPQNLQMHGQGQQPNYQQMSAQFSSDPASQQAYMRDMFGGGQQQQNPYQNVDFRAATFGGSLFPDTNKAPGAATTGSGGTNTPADYNPMQGGQLLGGNSWGGATNRRGGFGGMSLFGNQFGSGGSTGFGGTQPSQYRGAGSYGRPASYGQSQRPY